MPGGLSAATSYYIIALDDNNIAFASSYANALSDTRINLTSFGTGVHSIIPQGQTSAGGFTFGNGYGLSDFVTANYGAGSGNAGSIFLSTAEGTINAHGTITTSGVGINAAQISDFNSDGINDLAFANSDGSVTVHMGNSTQTMSMGFVDLTNQESSRNALTFLLENLTRISNEIASLGASQSRLEIAATRTASTIIGYQSASESIMSADIAAESANYTRNSIKLKAGAAVLAQANLSPKLALKLLDNN